MSLETKKLKAELAAVYSARLNLEVQIEERLEDIERLKKHVVLQELKEQELAERLKKLEG